MDGSTFLVIDSILRTENKSCARHGSRDDQMKKTLIAFAALAMCFSVAIFTPDLTFFELHGNVKKMTWYNITYEFDEKGNLTKINGENPSQLYRRDNEGRIVATEGEVNTNYYWDSMQLTGYHVPEIGEISIKYDERGFRTEESGEFFGTTTYTYENIDENGNWLSRKNSDGEKEIREIEYYVNASSTNNNKTAQKAQQKPIPDGYVDLGLPSGTIWKTSNERGLLTHNDASSRFYKQMPSKKDFNELMELCTWTWTGNGYTVQGPNGNSIMLPAAGFSSCENLYMGGGRVGSYWSSINDGPNAWYLHFTIPQGNPSGDYHLGSSQRCQKRSIRLVLRNE